MHQDWFEVFFIALTTPICHSRLLNSLKDAASSSYNNIDGINIEYRTLIIKLVWLWTYNAVNGRNNSISFRFMSWHNREPGCQILWPKNPSVIVSSYF